MSELTLAAALEYAGRGMGVLPIWGPGELPGTCACSPNGACPSGSPAKHPYGEFAPNGANSATTNPDIIKHWLSNNNLNIGIAGGNSYAIFDIDHEGVRDAVLAAKIKTAIALSGKGCHLYFLVRGDLPHSTLVTLEDGTHVGEIRCVGQYVVAPPSRHTSGVQYRWLNGSETMPAVATVDDLYETVGGILRKVGYTAKIAAVARYEIPERPVAVFELPFNTEYFPFVGQVLAGGYPTTNRSKMLRQFSLALVEAALAMNSDLTQDQLAGIIRKADEMNGGKFVNRRDADKRYLEYAIQALGGVESVMQKPKPVIEFDEIGQAQVTYGRKRGRFEILSAQELSAKVDAMPPPTWLAKPVWPSDAYGVIAASDKSGKTWSICDLAVSKASGYAWMGMFPCPEAGPVIIFFGEGGDRKMLRRMRAVCTHKGISYDNLPIHCCFRVPHLANNEDLMHIDQELTEFPASMMVIDPLYLAARGAKQGDLYDMGANLEPVQAIAQRHGVALVVVTHFKKSGEDEGFKRITGVGPGAWGRVLATATTTSVSGEVENEGETVVDMEWEFIGDEISDVKRAVRRRIWAEDQEDLASPMHYELEEIDVAEGISVNLSKNEGRVSTFLATQKEPMTAAQIAAILGLAPRTVQRTLTDLEGKQLAINMGGDRKNGHTWANCLVLDPGELV